MSSHEVGAVEVCATGQGVPPFARNDTTIACGVVVLWSRRWEAPRQRGDDVHAEICEPAGDDGSVTVEGPVRDAFTGVLLPDATVRATVSDPDGGEARSQETLADRDVRFRVSDLPRSGSVCLQASTAAHPGPRVTVEPGTRLAVARDLEVELSGPGRVVGRVLERESGRPLAASEVAGPSAPCGLVAIWTA